MGIRTDRRDSLVRTRVAVLAVGGGQSLIGAMLAVSTFGLLTAVLAWVQARFPRTAGLVEGQPVVVVRRGELQREAMKLERLAVTDLLQAAREQGIRDLREVDLAVLEVDGAISFFAAQVAHGGDNGE